MLASVVVPTYNESQNMPELLRRIHETLDPSHEVVIVDDGTDDLPSRVEAERKRYSERNIQVLRRESATGGLGGAIAEGITIARGDIIVVCDGDLQHPPEAIPSLLAAIEHVDVAVASRYCAGGRSDGLSSRWRILASRGSGSLSKLLFPKRLAQCSDPMSGFFAVRRGYIIEQNLQPNGFKILLELLLRAEAPEISEVPYCFANRHRGSSNFSAVEGFRLLKKLLTIRLSGRFTKYLLVGLAGVAPNLLTIALLSDVGVHYLYASLAGVQVGLVWNFFGAETYVWRANLGYGALSPLRRARRFILIGGTDIVRIPFVVGLVQFGNLDVLEASLATMIAAFALRFTLAEKLIYKSANQTQTQVVSMGGVHHVDA